MIITNSLIHSDRPQHRKIVDKALNFSKEGGFYVPQSKLNEGKMSFNNPEQQTRIEQQNQDDSRVSKQRILDVISSNNNNNNNNNINNSSSINNNSISNNFNGSSSKGAQNQANGSYIVYPISKFDSQVKSQSINGPSGNQIYMNVIHRYKKQRRPIILNNQENSLNLCVEPQRELEQNNSIENQENSPLKTTLQTEQSYYNKNLANISHNNTKDYNNNNNNNNNSGGNFKGGNEQLDKSSLKIITNKIRSSSSERHLVIHRTKERQCQHDRQILCQDAGGGMTERNNYLNKPLVTNQQIIRQNMGFFGQKSSSNSRMGQVGRDQASQMPNDYVAGMIINNMKELSNMNLNITNAHSNYINEQSFPLPMIPMEIQSYDISVDQLKNIKDFKNPNERKQSLDKIGEIQHSVRLEKNKPPINKRPQTSFQMRNDLSGLDIWANSKNQITINLKKVSEQSDVENDTIGNQKDEINFEKPKKSQISSVDKLRSTLYKNQKEPSAAVTFRQPDLPKFRQFPNQYNKQLNFGSSNNHENGYYGANSTNLNNQVVFHNNNFFSNETHNLTSKMDNILIINPLKNQPLHSQKSKQKNQNKTLVVSQAVMSDQLRKKREFQQESLEKQVLLRLYQQLDHLLPNMAAKIQASDEQKFENFSYSTSTNNTRKSSLNKFQPYNAIISNNSNLNQLESYYKDSRSGQVSGKQDYSVIQEGVVQTKKKSKAQSGDFRLKKEKSRNLNEIIQGWNLNDVSQNTEFVQSQEPF